MPTGLQPVIDAFYFLQTSRYPTFGAALSPIPSHAVLQYCDTFGWRGEDRFIFIRLLSAIDVTYVKLINEELKAESKIK